MKRIMAGMLMIMAPVLFSTASAHGGHNSIRHEQYEQQSRIHRGKRSGQLNHREAMALQMQQAKIEHYKEMAKADGRISRPERKLIKHEQRKANRNIHRQKHDCQHRN